MKILFILTLSSLMTLGITSISQASIVSVDYCGNASWGASQSSINYDGQFDNFKLGLNVINSAVEKSTTQEIILKAGYMVLSDNRFKIAITTGYYYADSTYIYETEYEEVVDYSLLLGLDNKLKISNAIWLDLNYLLWVNPHAKLVSTTSPYPTTITPPDYIELFSYKLNYKFNSGFGLSLGHFILCPDHDYSNAYSGTTVGAFYRF